MGKNYVPGEYERILKALPGYLRLFCYLQVLSFLCYVESFAFVRACVSIQE